MDHQVIGLGKNVYATLGEEYTPDYCGPLDPLPFDKWLDRQMAASGYRGLLIAAAIESVIDPDDPEDFVPFCAMIWETQYEEYVRDFLAQQPIVTSDQASKFLPAQTPHA